MLNAPAGVARAMARLRPTQSERTPRANRFHRRSVGLARDLGARVGAVRDLAPLTRFETGRFRTTALRRALRVRLGSERVLPIVAALVVLFASVLSFQPSAASATGNVNSAGAQARLAIGGEQLDPAEVAMIDGAAGAVEFDPSGPSGINLPGETFADDGTVYKPVAVDTSVKDGRNLLETYTVKSGDTLTGIASHYGISMMTIWWANKLTAKDQLHIGQKLVVPPVDGLVVTVAVGDTLESLAAHYHVDAAQILEVNGLVDPTLIVGQTLILPDALGKGIPTPKPLPVARGSANSSCNCAGPSSYSGGRFSWPVVGGGNYISQSFHYGHYGLDIAADYGSSVDAAGDGTVVFAGWRGGGGAYQVWISHGSGLYTTYNHLSAILVSAGQDVSRGERIGRVGQSGHATGPHLHFEVWVGTVWNGGSRVNPLRYY